MTPGLSAVRWSRSWKIIPTRHPREDLFERIAEGDDRRLLNDIEKLTNPSARLESGEKRFLRPGDDFPTPCSPYLRAAFSHPGRTSRFCDGNYPVCYSARALETAMEESKHARSVFLQSTREAAGIFPMRMYILAIAGDFHDLRGKQMVWRDVYSPSAYTASQALGARLWKSGSAGIVYDSVRHPGGQCAAIFSPRVVRRYQRGDVLLFAWDGNKIEVYQKR